MSQAPALSEPRASGPRYRRRRPESTALYRILQQHLETFVARVEASATAVHWPRFGSALNLKRVRRYVARSASAKLCPP